MAGRRNERSLSIGTKMLFSHLLLGVAILLLASVLSYALTYQYMKQKIGRAHV